MLRVCCVYDDNRVMTDCEGSFFFLVSDRHSSARRRVYRSSTYLLPFFYRKKQEIIGRAAAPPGKGSCSSLARVAVRAIRALERAAKHVLLGTIVYPARENTE